MRDEDVRGRAKERYLKGRPYWRIVISIQAQTEFAGGRKWPDFLIFTGGRSFNLPMFFHAELDYASFVHRWSRTGRIEHVRTELVCATPPELSTARLNKSVQSSLSFFFQSGMICNHNTSNHS